jgi:hypothetical protein
VDVTFMPCVANLEKVKGVVYKFYVCCGIKMKILSHFENRPNITSQSRQRE